MQNAVVVAMMSLLIFTGGCKSENMERQKTGQKGGSAVQEENSSEVNTEAGTEESGKAEGSSDDDDVTFTKSQIPIAIAGSNFVKATYENTRVRCDYKNSDNGYDVACEAVALQGGQELAVIGIADGITLTWAEPTLSSASPVTKECSVSNDSLKQTCSLTTENRSTSIKVNHSLQVKDNEAAKTRNEVMAVNLPYAVGIAAGVVPSIPFRMHREEAKSNMADDPKAPQLEFGFQRAEVATGRINMSYVQASCFRDEKTAFVSVESFIYQVDFQKNVMTLYAGKATGADDKSHRYRLRLKPTDITCEEKSLIVSDFKSNRLLRLHDSGKVDVIFNNTADDNHVLGFKGGKQILLPDGSIIFSDPIAAVVRKVDKNGVATIIAGVGSQGTGANGILATNSALRAPTGLVLLANGDILVAESFGFRIRRIDTAGIIHAYAGNGLNENSGENGPATSAGIGPVADLALDTNNNIIIATQAFIKKISANGTISTLVSYVDVNDLTLNNGSYVLSANTGLFRLNDDASKTKLIGELGAPTDEVIAGDKLHLSSPYIFFNSAGRLLVSEYQRGVVYQQAVATNDFTMIKNMQVSYNDLFLPDSQRLFFSYMHELQEMVKLPSGFNQYITIAGGTVAGYEDASPATAGKITTVTKKAVGTDGTIYFFDAPETDPNSSNFALLRKVTPNQDLITIAGKVTSGYSFSPDGTLATNARLDMGSIAVDGTNKIVFGQKFHIRTLDAQGKLVTLAGGGSNVADGIDALTASVKPDKIVFGPSGTIYFIDITTNRVRILLPKAGGGYKIESVFAPSQDQDCATGIIKSTGMSQEDVQDKVKTSIASMCGGTITDIAVHHSCGSGNSELITIAIAQDFGSSGNVLKIEMPCTN